MLDWLEATALSEWVNYSRWGYGITLSAHGVGMAIVVGLTAVIAMRVLGFAKGIPLGSLRLLMPTMIFGMVLNTISGIVLFMASASTFFYNTSFQIKILMIILGVVLLVYLDKLLLKPAYEARNSGGVEMPLSGSVKAMAVGAILIWWVAVVLSGRLIAYVGG